MTPSDHLFLLIKKLSPSEKRYFKLYASRQGDAEKSNNLKLFELLNEMEEYNEELFRQKVQELSPDSQPAFVKNYLKTVIMRCLREYHHEYSAQMIVRNYLADFEILLSKGLWKQSGKVLRKAFKYVEKYELSNLMPQVMRMWTRQLGTVRSPSFFQDMLELGRLQKIWMQKLASETELVHLAQTLNAYRTHYASNNKKAKAIADEYVELANNVDRKVELTFTAKIALKQVHWIRSLIIGDVLDVLKYSRNIMEVYEDHPHQIKKNPRLFAATVMNYLSRSVEVQTDDFNDRIEQLKSLRGLTQTDRMILIYRSMNLKMIQSYNVRKKSSLEEWRATFSEIEVMHDQVPLEYSKLSRFCANFLAACMAFIEKDFNYSLKLVNSILVDERDYTIYWKVAARNLNLIIHYELENLDLLEYQISSTIRFLKNVNSYTDFEKRIISDLRKLIKEPGNEKKREIFEGLFQWGLQRGMQSGSLAEVEVLAIIWSYAKANQASFKEVFLTKSQEFTSFQLKKALAS